MDNRELDAWLTEHLLDECPHLELEYYCIEDGNSVDSGHTCRRCGIDMSGVKERKLSTTGDGMLMVIEAMKVKGWKIELHELHNGEYEFGFSKYDDVKGLTERTRQAPHIPTAVALAAKAALEGDTTPLGKTREQV